MFRDPFDPFGGWGRPPRDPYAQPRRPSPPVDAWGRPIRRAPEPPPAPPVRRGWSDPRVPRDSHADERFRDERFAQERYPTRGPASERPEPPTPARSRFASAPRSPVAEPQ